VLARRGLSALTIAAALTLAGCGGGSGDTSTAAADTQKAPVKIGLVLPATGPLTPNGQGNKDGFEFYWDQHAHVAGGHPVQIVNADDEGKPDVAVAKVQELLEKDKVDLLAGFVSSASALAARDLAVRTQTPMVVTQAATSKLTSGDSSGLVSRVIATFEETMSAVTRTAVVDDGVKKIVFMGSDYVAGKDAETAVKATAQSNGATVTKSVFAPLGTQDFAPFLANVTADTDAVVAFFGGTDAVRFVQQYSEFGLKGKTPLYGHWSLTVDPLLVQQGKAAEGLVTVQEYSATIENAASTSFIEAWKAKNGGAVPNAWNEQGYVAAMAIAAGLESSGGAVKGAALAKAIRGAQIDAPRGKVTFDDKGQIVQPLYIARVKVQGSGFVNALDPSKSVK
jgi:branched-chain amino acid transport system substrate-binding protein